jgi:hypothetical protein
VVVSIRDHYRQVAHLRRADSYVAKTTDLVGFTTAVRSIASHWIKAGGFVETTIIEEG